MGKKRANINEKDWRNNPRKYHGPRLREGNAVALNMNHPDFDLTLGVFGTTFEGRSVKVQPSDRLIVSRARAVLRIDGVDHTKMTRVRFAHGGDVWGEAGIKTERSISAATVFFIKRDYLSRDPNQWLKPSTSTSDAKESATLADTLAAPLKFNTGESEGSDQGKRSPGLKRGSLRDDQITGDMYRVAGFVKDISDRLVGVDKVAPVDIALKVAEILDRGQV